MAQKDSPPQAESGRSLRNPRRRNRVDSESIKVAPRRKRSKITETTFLPRDSPDEHEEEVAHTNGNGRVVSGRSNGRLASASLASDLDLPVRAARNGTKRAARADGAKVLTQNENYSVKLLSSTPRDLTRRDVDFRGSISTSANLALALTHDKAYVWDYNGLSGAASKSVDITFHTTSHDALPFGAFVASSTNADAGLLLVSASGKIIYHESIERVTSLGFFQERRDGIEGVITGSFSGEKVIQLVDVSPAGFVALLSSGRTAHISLRDAQGKAKISTQFLYTSEQHSNGFFGSIKSIFGAGAWQQSISALRVRSLDRGQVQVLGLMEKGELRIWDLDWSGRYDFRASVDFREQLQHELRQMRPVERHGEIDNLVLLDIAVLDHSTANKLEVASLASTRPLDASLLIRCGATGMYSYALMQFSLVGNDFSITRILDVQASTQKSSSSHVERLLIPEPGHTALVVLPDSIVVMSLATAALHPESQFHETSYIEPSPYQDTIYLQPDRDVSFTGGDTDISRTYADSASIVYVRGAGFVRITTHESRSDSDDTAAAAKSKLEQAVFYGFQDGTILDLLRPGQNSIADDDIELAAINISNDILHSSSPFFELPPISVTANLQKRADAASHLAIYLQKLHPHLPRKVKWRLLTNAEKIAAAVKLWSQYEKQLSSAVKGRKKDSMLHAACQMVDEKQSYDTLWPDSSDDIVRTFFVTQVEHIGALLPWIRLVLATMREESPQASFELIRLVSEATDIWLGCLQTAYTFRRDNAAAFGVHLNMIEHDTAPDPHDLQEVDEPWTCADDLMKETVKFIDLTRQAVKDIYEVTQDPEVDAISRKVAPENSLLVDLMCQMHLERIAWCRSRGTVKYDTQAERLLDALNQERAIKIRELVELGQVDASIALADKYRDMKTLTETLIAESQYLEEESYVADEVAKIEAKRQVAKIIDKVNKYFEKFGDDFAEAFFGEGFTAGSGKMLSETHDWDEHMTKWLRRDPSRAKACWINDVVRVQDFKHAAQSLHQLASDQEESIWNKNIELSLAKLAMHAHFEDATAQDQVLVKSMDYEIDNDMQVVDVQQRFYKHIQTETYHALDEEAAIEEVMRSLYDKLLAFRHWHGVLRQSVTQALLHRSLRPEELIDLLTQADPTPLSITDRDLDRSETFEALEVVAALKGRSSADLEMLARLIWKRAYLNEDWDAINESAAKESEEDMWEILQKTNVYRAMAHVLNANLINGNDIFTIVLPRQTLGAGTHIDDVGKYIPFDTRPKILEENMIMERQIENSIKHKRMEHWVQSIKDMAGRAVSATSDQHIDGDGAIKEEELDMPTDLTTIAPGHFDSDIEMAD